MSIKTQHGIALMTVIMFLFIMSLTWLSFSFINSYESDVLQKQVASEQASYVAEAGIQQALWLLSRPADLTESPRPWDWQNWPDNYKGTGGTKVAQGNLTYYQWSGNLGDSNQTYTVQIRNDGKIQSKIKVGSPNLDSPKRTIEVELGSAFDYGLYSHKNLEFRSRSFTVSENNQKGYVYSKDGITAGSSLLTANKITGNYSTAPWYLPKEIPLPELWKTKTVNPQTGNITWIGFDAKINGTPTATQIRYTIDSSEPEKETYLVRGALLHNKTRGNFRKISSTVYPNIGTNTITTETSTDDWAAGDKIVVERVEVYENYWNTLNTQLTYLNSVSYGTTSSASGYAPDNCSPSRSFSNVNFTPSTPPVQFEGNTIFSGNIKIDGNAVFGRKHDYGGIIACGFSTNSSGGTTIAGDMVVNGNAYFFNSVVITGHLYVTGSVYVADHVNNYNYQNPADNVNVVEDASGIDGIIINTNGGIFVQSGTLYLKKNGTPGGLQINGYCYVNGDTTIESNLSPPTPVVNPATAPPYTTIAIYSRNGSLIVGSPAYPQTLSGWGKIIVGQNLTIRQDIYAPQSNTPLFIASGGNLKIERDIGTTSPFYGMVYVGENTNIGNKTTISGGLMVVNGFDPNRPYLSGTSITYKDFKSLLTDVGFTNNRDFVRPLLWRETE